MRSKQNKRESWNETSTNHHQMEIAAREATTFMYTTHNKKHNNQI